VGVVLRARRPLLALVLLGVLLGGGYLLSAVRSDPGFAGPAAGPAVSTTTPAWTSAPATPARSELSTVPASALPVEARRTLQLIDRGGPFPYDQDGGVFGNVEQMLPRQPIGWYREYTVPTPGESDGARRIVAGRDGTRYYTADHNASFVVVQEDR
jgi:ribonuclease T1